MHFPHDAPMPHDDFMRFNAGNGFSIANVSYRYSVELRYYEDQAIIRTHNPWDVKRLSEALVSTGRWWNSASHLLVTDAP